MGTCRSRGVTRRDALTAAAVVGATALGAGLVGLPGGGTARAAMGGGGGLAGGGVLETADGEVQFSVFGSRLTCEGDTEPTIFGRVQWTDPGWRSRGLMLESTEIIEYGPPQDDPDGNVRELRGMMRQVGDDGGVSYPFLLRAEDVDVPGAGADTVTLRVGQDALGTPSAATPSDDFSYRADGTVVRGDVQLLSFEEPNQG